MAYCEPTSPVLPDPDGGGGGALGPEWSDAISGTSPGDTSGPADESVTLGASDYSWGDSTSDSSSSDEGEDQSGSDDDGSGDDGSGDSGPGADPAAAAASTESAGQDAGASAAESAAAADSAAEAAVSAETQAFWSGMGSWLGQEGYNADPSGVFVQHYGGASTHEDSGLSAEDNLDDPNGAAATDIINSVMSGGPYDANYAASIGLQITGAGPGYVAAIYSGEALGGDVDTLTDGSESESESDSDYYTALLGAEAPADDSEGSTPGLAEPPQIVASEGTAQGWSSDAETGNDTGMSGLVYDEDKQKNYLTDDGTRVNTYSDGSWVQIDPDSGTILATGSSLAGAPAAMTYQTPTGTRVEVMPDGSWREYDQLGDRVIASGTSADQAPDAAPEPDPPASPPGETGTPDNPDAGKLWADPTGRMHGVRLYTPANPDEDAGYLDAAGIAHGGDGTQASAPAATSIISGTTISAAANPSAAPANDVGDTYDSTDDSKSLPYSAADITSRVVFSSRPAVGDIVIVDGAYVQITGVAAAPPGSNVSFVFASASPTQNVALDQELANTPLSSGPEPDTGSEVSDWVRVLAGVTPFVNPPGGPLMPPAPLDAPIEWPGGPFAPSFGTGAGLGSGGTVAAGGAAGEVGGVVGTGAAVEGGVGTTVAAVGGGVAGTIAGVAAGLVVVGTLGSIILDRILNPGTFSEDDPSGVEEARTGIGAAARDSARLPGVDGGRPITAPGGESNTDGGDVFPGAGGNDPLAAPGAAGWMPIDDPGNAVPEMISAAGEHVPIPPPRTDPPATTGDTPPMQNIIVSDSVADRGEFDWYISDEHMVVEDKAADGARFEDPASVQTWVEKIMLQTDLRLTRLPDATDVWSDEGDAPSLEELQGARDYLFRIQNDDPRLPQFIEPKVQELNELHPDWNFWIQYGVPGGVRKLVPRK
jgi:hypothetical protein